MGNHVPASISIQAPPYSATAALFGRPRQNGRFGIRAAEMPVRDRARSWSWPLLDGDGGTAQTIDLIRRAVRESQADPVVRAAARRILQGVPANDDLAEARALYEWVLRNIRYTNDPVDFETVSNARYTLVHRFGDCDDINAVLLPSLLSVTGHPVRLVTVSNHPAAPDAFSHVYAEVEINGRWIPVDAARRNARFGAAPARYFRKRIWSLTSKSYQDVSGLSGQRVSMGIDWQSILQAGTESAKQIIAQVRGTTYIPPAPPSQITAQQQPGGGYSVGASNNALLAIGGAALGVGLLASRK